MWGVSILFTRQGRWDVIPHDNTQNLTVFSPDLSPTTVKYQCEARGIPINRGKDSQQQMKELKCYRVIKIGATKIPKISKEELVEYPCY